jgi:hypothetical protein
MEAITGVFDSRSDAEGTVEKLRASGLSADKVTLLTPGEKAKIEKELHTVPVVAAEQSGMGKTIGGVVGAAAGLSGGPLLAAVIPGVGPILAAGLLGAAILGAAGASLGAVAGGKLEDSMTDGLPEDEVFVYEDALRKGRSVVIALTEEGTDSSRIRELLKAGGAEAIDAAKEQWWIGIRSAEQEHYSKFKKDFSDDEKFYRLGFESALHAKRRCQEYDQGLAEMESAIEELQQQNPGVEVAEPFSRGYERGREHYQHLCKESRAA